MKILYAVESVNLSGGYDRVIIEKANYLAEHGFDVIITVASHALASDLLISKSTFISSMAITYSIELLYIL